MKVLTPTQRIEAAKIFGRDAALRGEMKAPALNSGYRALIADLMVGDGASAIAIAWSHGWDEGAQERNRRAWDRSFADGKRDGEAIVAAEPFDGWEDNDLIRDVRAKCFIEAAHGVDPAYEQGLHVGLGARGAPDLCDYCGTYPVASDYGACEDCRAYHEDDESSHGPRIYQGGREIPRGSAAYDLALDGIRVADGKEAR